MPGTLSVNPKGEDPGDRCFSTPSEPCLRMSMCRDHLPAAATAQAMRECAERESGTSSSLRVVLPRSMKPAPVFRKNWFASCGEGAPGLGPNTSGHTSTPQGFTSTFFPREDPAGPGFLHCPDGKFRHPHPEVHLTGRAFRCVPVVGLGNKVGLRRDGCLGIPGGGPETSAS